MGFWIVEGAYANAVISGILTVTIKGQTATRAGTMAYTFSKERNEWKIGAQAGAVHRSCTNRLVRFRRLNIQKNRGITSQCDKAHK